MIRHIFIRLLTTIPLLLCMTLITFLLIHAAPGDYLATLKANPLISKEYLDALIQTYHLDKPLLIQFIHWLKGLLVGDLGFSFSKYQPVSSLILSRLGPTLLLALSSLLFTWLVAIPLGIYTAIHRSKRRDKILSSISLLGVSTPNFFLALLLIYLASLSNGLWPTGGMISNIGRSAGTAGYLLDLLKHLIIPTIVISTASMAALMRITRGKMLDVLSQNYILMARAKGLPEHKVLYKHALKNAINPLITIFGFELAGLLSGAALVEIVTNWPGMGSLMLEAVLAQDLHLILGNLLIAGLMLIIGNLIADILLSINDPRIRDAQN